MSQTPATSLEELREYEIYVARMAALADGRVIKNSSLEHAAIIIAQIFKTSTTTVDILTGSLDARVYGCERVSGAAVDFLNRNGNIRILSEKEVQGDNPLLVAAGSLNNARISIRRFPESIQTPSHFAIGDREHLRFEADKKTCNASAMFGVKSEAQSLAATFDKIFAASA